MVNNFKSLGRQPKLALQVRKMVWNFHPNPSSNNKTIVILVGVINYFGWSRDIAEDSFTAVSLQDPSDSPNFHGFSKFKMQQWRKKGWVWVEICIPMVATQKSCTRSTLGSPVVTSQEWINLESTGWLQLWLPMPWTSSHYMACYRCGENRHLEEDLDVPPTVGNLMKSVYSNDPGSTVSHHSPYDSLDFHDLATQLAPFSVNWQCNTPSRRKKKRWL